MPTEPQPLSVAEAVREAAEVCDPGDESEQLDRFLQYFEDADEPIAAVADVEELIDNALDALGIDEPEPPLAMARAVVVYVAHRRDEHAEDPHTLLRLAARAEFDGQPPSAIAEWLEQRGVSP
jgi:hypothetical protein